MIEFRFIDIDNWIPGNADNTSAWVSVSHSMIIENVNFERAELRIDGVVYKEDTEELRKTFTKAKIWMTLQE